MNTPKYDIIAIGDTVVDAFIRIQVGTVETVHGETSYCVPFGSKIPYENVYVLPAVGNSANAAVSAARLGVKSALLTFIGKDANGTDCLKKLEEEGVGTDFINIEVGKKTNYHYVLWHGDERTILVKHEAFQSHLPDIGQPKWIYLSSLGSHTKALHEELDAYLASNLDVKLAFQPGTFQIQMGTEALKGIYARTEIFCANLEEYMQILGTDNRDVKFLMDKMAELGPKILILSDGPHGAYMKANGKHYQMPLYPDIAPPFERTGAGDAFCSTFVSAIVLGKSPEEAILWAPINSMSVVQCIGAQEGLLSQERIKEYLAKAPKDYVLKEI